MLESFRASTITPIGRALATALLLAGSTSAQETLCPCPPPAPPPPVWTGSLAGGLSLTGGNSEARSYTLDFALVRDPKTKDLFKADGFYLRTDTAGTTAVDRTGLGARYERRLGSGHAFAFGDARYLHDAIKDVDYLITPSVGLGYRFVERDTLKVTADAGLGLAFEQLTDQATTTTGAVSGGENLHWKFSQHASFVHTARGLWKVKDFGDAYYHFDVGIVASLANRFELKVTFADDYKTLPPLGKQKNDTSLLAAIVLKL